MKIGLAINSHKPRMDWLEQCLKTAKYFDKIFLYVQGVTDEQYKQIESWNIERIYIERGIAEVGIVDGFNHAIRMMQTDWVCSFCDDDYFIEENTRELIDRVKSGAFADADVIHFQVAVDNGGGWGEANVTEEGLREGNMLPHGSFFRKKIFDELNGYKCEFGTDWEFWLRAIRNGAKFSYFEKPCYVFRVKNEGAYQRQLQEIGGIGKMREAILKSAGV